MITSSTQLDKIAAYKYSGDLHATVSVHDSESATLTVGTQSASVVLHLSAAGCLSLGNALIAAAAEIEAMKQVAA